MGVNSGSSWQSEFASGTLSTGSGRSVFSTAISSQRWNFGHRRQSFQTFSGSMPRSTARKPNLRKKFATYVKANRVQFVRDRFILQGLNHRPAKPLRLQRRVHRQGANFPRYGRIEVQSAAGEQFLAGINDRKIADIF